MGDLDGRIAVVTGAARGLGAATAELLVREGATVVATDVRTEEGTALAARLGAAVSFAELDVTEESAWNALVTDVVREHGRVDVLVNNAGVVGFYPVLATSAAEYLRVMDINATGVFLGIRAVLPHMIEARSGVIVNIASVDGQRGMPGTAPYAASKHAVLGLTRSCALEVARLGVRVNAVCPGMMATGMADDANAGELGEVDVAGMINLVPMGRIAEPTEVAEAVVWLAGDKASFVTGTEIVVDGGWTTGLPIPPAG